MTTKRIEWRSRDAWIALLAVLFSQMLVAGLVWAVWIPYPKIAYWVRTPLGMTLYLGFGHAVGFGVAVYCSRIGSLAEFVTTLDLRRPSKSAGATGVVIGVFFALTAAYLGGLGEAPQRPWIGAIRGTGGEHRYYLTLLSLWGAPIEEIVLRGFFYRAFRGSWGLIPSLACILAIDVLAHKSMLSGSLPALVLFSILTVLLCLIREQTKSLWNCILCHLVYNAALCEPLGSLLNYALRGLA
jgi:membrane protease YdiL (CAAX protease family)